MFMTSCWIQTIEQKMHNQLKTSLVWQRKHFPANVQKDV